MEGEEGESVSNLKILWGLTKIENQHDLCLEVLALLSLLQKVCPEWKDARGIMAMLRVCNYSIEDCTSAYMAINDDGKFATDSPLPCPCTTPPEHQLH